MFHQCGCCELALAQPVAAVVKTLNTGMLTRHLMHFQGLASCPSPGDNFSKYFSVLFQVQAVRGRGQWCPEPQDRLGRSQSCGFPIPVAVPKKTALKCCQGSRATRCLNPLGQNTSCWLTSEQETRGAGLSWLSGEVPPASCSWHW